MLKAFLHLYNWGMFGQWKGESSTALEPKSCIGMSSGDEYWRALRNSGELNSRPLKLRLELRWQLKSPHISTSGASISWLTYMNASTASASSVWRGLKSVFPYWGTEGLGLQLCQFDTSWQNRPPSLALCFLAFLSNISGFLRKEIT